MAKVKFPLEQVLEENQSAMTDRHPRYKKLKKRFKKNLLAMDYEKDLEKKKKKKKLKLKEEWENMGIGGLEDLSHVQFKKAIKDGLYNKEKVDGTDIIDILICKYVDALANERKSWKEIFAYVKRIVNSSAYLTLTDVKDFVEKANLYGWAYDQQKLMKKAAPTGISFAKEITKEIKSTAIKLPKKKLKLEGAGTDTISNFNKRFEAMPKGPLNLKQIETIVKLYKEVDDYHYDILTKKIEIDNEVKLYKEVMELINELEEFMMGINDWTNVDAFGAKSIMTKILGAQASEEITYDWSFGKDSAKKEIERLRKASTKLPKKKLKLESSLNETVKQNEIISLLKEKLPETKNIKKYKKDAGVGFTYEGVRYTVYKKKGSRSANAFPYYNNQQRELIYNLNSQISKKIKKVENILYTMDIKDVKIITKQIRDTSTKLPKKKLTLEDTLNEQDISQDDMIKFIKKKLPEATNIHKLKKYIGILFTYNNFRFSLAEKDGLIITSPINFSSIPHERTAVMETWANVNNLLNTLTKEEAIKITKKIRDTATKLPKKKMKLEDTLNEELERLTKEKIKEKIYSGRDPLVILGNLVEARYSRYFITLNDYFNYLEENWKTLEKNSRYDVLSVLNTVGHNMPVLKLNFDYKKAQVLAEKIVKQKGGKGVDLKAYAEMGEDRQYSGWKHFDYSQGKKFLKSFGVEGEKVLEKALTSWPKGIEGAKKITKKIKNTATKLPKKKLKLEDILEDADYIAKARKLKIKAKERIKDKIPNVIKIDDESTPDFFLFYVFVKHNGKEEIFDISSDNDRGDVRGFLVSQILDRNFEEMPHDTKRAKEIETLLAPDTKDAKEITKKIRDTATKLPKKKMKLEDYIGQSE